MIEIKLKACHGCKELKQIWKSHGKHKYCKTCWYKMEKPKAIPPVSKKMQQIMSEYSKKRIAFLVVNEHCQARLVSCTHTATDIHHKAGRGENHNVISTWLAVCRSCHQWIEENPEQAKELGYSENRLN